MVDAGLEQGLLTPIWQALAQGGEEKYPFPAVIAEIANLKPKYIRIDQILQTGALPFLCLSYMPPAISQENQITNAPENWPDWQEVVKATIQHFSGKKERNLDNIIYEVWNEPDLFGNWRAGSDGPLSQLDK